MNKFLNKTIKTAKKHLLEGKDPRDVDRYLRVRKFMFDREFPGETARFLHIVGFALRRFLIPSPPIP